MTILLVPGFMADAALWDDLLPHLPDSCGLMIVTCPRTSAFSVVSMVL